MEFKAPQRTDRDGLIREDVYALAKQGPISKDVWDKLYLNTYERNFLLEYVSNQVLLETCKQHLNNVTQEYDATYETEIIHKLFPEVCKRFQKILEK